MIEKTAPPVDVLTATAGDLSALLAESKVTSLQLVDAYLAQIEKHNWSGLQLRAIISVCRASAVEQAIQLDDEREEGRVRGPLHGIPIILKDCIQTNAKLGMPTTSGAAVFKRAMARNDAEVVRRLREAGLIILGKASLTEYCGAKGRAHTTGWNSINGQTQSVWIEGGFRPDDLFYGRSAPGGSSSGSAVGVAAGFAPLAVGTETGGSCCLPANRSALYMLKLSHDPELVRGVMPLCKDFDGLGAFARSAADVETLAQIMAGPRSLSEQAPETKQLRIGLVDPTKWFAVPEVEAQWDNSHLQIMASFEEAKPRMRSMGAEVVYPIDLPSLNNFSYKDKSLLQHMSYADIKYEWPAWIANMDNAPVKNVEEIIEWNKTHPSIGMPKPHDDQDFLLDVQASSVTAEDAANAAAEIYPKARKAIEDCLASNDIDIIISPADSGICVLASIAKAPSAIVPMTILRGDKGMGQPQGLMIISRPHGEAKMLDFMKRWEKAQGLWKIPTRLISSQ